MFGFSWEYGTILYLSGRKQGIARVGSEPSINGIEIAPGHNSSAR